MNTTPSILIVDDELENFDVLEAMLMTEKYQLHYAANGIQALSFLEMHQPDLILLDVMMPGMDGIETCRRIKAKRHWMHTPIVMVSALNSKEDLVKCLDAGATDFLSKPTHSSELRARVRSMLRIKQQHDELQSLLQIREDMVGMMVHDLRNPLTSIILSTELLRIAHLSPEQRQDKIDKIAIAAHHLRLQIDSLLLMAKIEADKMVLNCTDIDLHALCMSALGDVEAMASQKHLTITTHLPDPGGSVYVDANVFRRILDNLLSNAIKFSPSNSTVVLQVDYLEKGGAVIRVIDQGPGVSEEKKHSIFDKYEIGTPITGINQIGLGLAFVKLAIEAHGGEIAVENNQPRGTTFTLRFTA